MISAASTVYRRSGGRYRSDTKSRPRDPENPRASVGATGKVHRRSGRYPSCATENTFTQCKLLRRRQRQVPIIHKTIGLLQIQFMDVVDDEPVVQRQCRNQNSQKTVELRQVQFMDEVVDMTVAML